MQMTLVGKVLHDSEWISSEHGHLHIELPKAEIELGDHFMSPS
jgi:hypothetical protein